MIIKSRVNQISYEYSCSHDMRFLEIELLSFWQNCILVPHWSSTVNEVSTPWDPYVYVMLKNDLRRYSAVWDSASPRLTFLNADRDSWRNVETGCTQEVNLGICASSLVCIIVNRVAWILNKTFTGIHKQWTKLFGLVGVREVSKKIRRDASCCTC